MKTECSGFVQFPNVVYWRLMQLTICKPSTCRSYAPMTGTHDYQAIDGIHAAKEIACLLDVTVSSNEASCSGGNCERAGLLVSI